jgi:hypothetical protein
MRTSYETIAIDVERALNLRRMYRRQGQSDNITNSKVDSQPQIAPSNVHWCIPRPINTLFTGRAEILKRIENAITITGDVNMQRRFVITGIGGQGKSEICLKMVDRVRDTWVNVAFCNMLASNGRQFLGHLLG